LLVVLQLLLEPGQLVVEVQQLVCLLLHKARQGEAHLLCLLATLLLVLVEVVVGGLEVSRRSREGPGSGGV
jgi:hypothetical protein